MAKSKRRRRRKGERKRRGGSPRPAGLRKELAQDGTQVRIRSFQISDEAVDTYRPGITDEIGEATVLLKRGHADQAKAAFQSILDREPRAREAYTNLAVACTMSGDEERAEALIREAMRKFPKYVFPRINLARLHLRRGQVDEAEKLLIPLDNLRKFTSSEFYNYALTWGDLLAAHGEYEGAQAWLKMLLQVMPGAPGLWGRRIRWSIGRLLSRGR